MNISQGRSCLLMIRLSSGYLPLVCTKQAQSQLFKRPPIIKRQRGSSDSANAA